MDRRTIQITQYNEQNISMAQDVFADLLPAARRNPGAATRSWPELEKALKDHGVSNYSIFLRPGTRQLFGYAEIENEEQRASIGATEICQKWWKQNVEIMPSNPDHSPPSAPLREVFHLE
jgi:L-rhamnose mutarotase